MPDPRYQIPEQLAHVPDIVRALCDGWLDLDTVRPLCRVSTRTRAAFMPVLQIWELCILDKVLPGFFSPTGLAALPGGTLCVAECNGCDGNGVMHGPGNAFQIVDHVHAHHHMRSRPIVRMTVGPAIHRTPHQLIVPGPSDQEHIPTFLDGAIGCAYDGAGSVFVTDINGGLHKFQLRDGRFTGSMPEPDADHIAEQVAQLEEAQHGDAVQRLLDSYWRFGFPQSVAFGNGHVFVSNQESDAVKPDTIEVFTADFRHVRTIELGRRKKPFSLVVHDDKLYVLCNKDASGIEQAISCFSLEGEFLRHALVAKDISSFTIANERLVVARCLKTLTARLGSAWIDVFTLRGERRQQIPLGDVVTVCNAMCFDPEHQLLFATCEHPDSHTTVSADGGTRRGAVLVYRVMPDEPVSSRQY